MELIAPSALQEVAGDRHIAALCYQVDIAIIRHLTLG
ncbi:MAG: hypothetical protein QOG58_3828 [Caballeronia sp.]|jgi:hypothetical protein|nr:hypothetical protein [Caballeronia sp.]